MKRSELSPSKGKIGRKRAKVAGGLGIRKREKGRERSEEEKGRGKVKRGVRGVFRRL